jgi:hypothetical protein
LIKLYLDIDGVIINNKKSQPAEHAKEFIEYITTHFECYWLTTHCKVQAATAMRYLSNYFEPDVLQKLLTILPATWTTLKTEGIDFDVEFVWIEDYPFESEKKILEQNGAIERLFTVDLNTDGALKQVIGQLQSLK